MKPRTILCVDNEESALRLQRLVESAGYRVLTATSGTQAIEVLRLAAIDAVIVDYWMANMSGLEAAREMRRLRPQVPIIILSAYGELLNESLGIADLWIQNGEGKPEYLLSSLAELLEARARH